MLVIRLGFALGVINFVDLPGTGRIFLNHLPEVAKGKGEFILVRQEGPFGITVTPCASVGAGYKKARSAEALAELVLESGICEAFKSRNFHGSVAEGIEESLKQPCFECSFGRLVSLEDGSTVLVVSKESIPPGSLIEAAWARKSVLGVRVADFACTDPYSYDSFDGFVEGLLNAGRPRVSGRLVPKPAPKILTGIWAGEPLSFINARGQASCRVPLDGPEEGTYSVVYFTRKDGTPGVTIMTGAAVEVRHDHGSNFFVTPIEGQLATAVLIDPAEVPGQLGVALNAQELVPTNGARLVKSTA